MQYFLKSKIVWYVYWIAIYRNPIRSKMKLFQTTGNCWKLFFFCRKEFCVKYGRVSQLPHRPIEQSTLHRRIYWVVASKSLSIGINLFYFTAQHNSVARRLLPSFYCVIWKFVWKPWYLEAELVGGSVSGLTKAFVIVTF